MKKLIVCSLWTMLCLTPSVLMAAGEPSVMPCGCYDNNMFPVFIFSRKCASVECDEECAAECAEECAAECALYEEETPSTPEGPEDPQPSEGSSATQVPVLQNFDLINTYTEDELNFTFTPKGTASFALHVQLKSENGRDLLSAWCTGDEKLCKAVGNGQACSGTDYSGSNAWCYKAE